MIKHLLKLVWHRKRANALVMAEIFLSFLIVFAVVTLAVSIISRWRAPLGFEWRNVWLIEVSSVLPSSIHSTGAAPRSETAEAQQQAATVDRVLRELRSFPEVEAAAADAMTPYSGNTWSTVLPVNGRDVLVNADQATDGFADVMKIRPLKGRWFSPTDDGQSYVPMVVDTDVARELFGSTEAVGQRFTTANFTRGGGPKEFRVVGVIPPFRKDGELSDTSIRMVFIRASLLKPEPPAAERIVLRVRPGTPASFEAVLNERLRRGGGMSLDIKRLEDLRRMELRMRLVPLVALSLVAVFLISMVALGLTGVLWQTVTRRMREMGLRRAVGATGAGVRRQILGEVALLSTLSILAGAAIILQLPLLGAFRIVTPGEFATGFAGALVVIYGITLLCGGYPSWLASTIEPADALRYE